MFTKRTAIVSGFLFLILLLSACGAPATQAPATQAPHSNDYYEEPAATEAPAEEAYSPGLVAPADTSSSAPEAGPSKSGQQHPRSNREPYDMFFQEYGVNPSIDTEDDNLSTFALDVDTGSYTIMRNYLNDGNLPPSESVRVEEYVNYFEQGYPNPSQHQAFGVSIDGAPSPFTQSERYQMMRVGIQGYQVSDEDRKDASLTFVIDVSGSMDMDNRLGLVKRSLELLVEQLRSSDSVGIVVYGTEAHIVLEPTSGSDKGAILDAIYSLHPEGSTNAEAGIRLG
ncbi:MAG: vWA domain-containing protein, partial [Chloroflexota bacterium]